MFKRGQSNTTLIILIGVAVLALIVVLSVSIFLFKSEPQADPIGEQCKFVCDSGQRTGFCDVERNLKSGGTATCKELADQNKLGVQTCPGISCELTPEESDKTCVTGLGGTWESPVDGSCVQSGNKIRRELTPSDSPPVEGQICCK